MDKSIKRLYILMFKKNARVADCIIRRYGYDVHLEWDSEPFPIDTMYSDYDGIWGRGIETKIIVLTRR